MYKISRESSLLYCTFVVKSMISNLKVLLDLNDDKRKKEENAAVCLLRLQMKEANGFQRFVYPSIGLKTTVDNTI